MAVKTEVTLIDGTVITLAGGADQEFFLDHNQEVHGTPPASNTRTSGKYTTKVQGVFTESGIVTEKDEDDNVTTLGYSAERATPSLSGYDEDGRLVYVASTQIRSIALSDLPYEAPEVDEDTDEADVADEPVEDADVDSDDEDAVEDDDEDEAPKAKKGKKAKKK